MHDRLSGEGFRTWTKSYEQEWGVVRLYAFPLAALGGGRLMDRELHQGCINEQRRLVPDPEPCVDPDLGDDDSGRYALAIEYIS